MAQTSQLVARDYSRTSFWLETCSDDLTPRPPLDGSHTVDIAILGAGFSGLWTAYYLLQHEPSLHVVLVDREIAGFGASGRNGGWCTSGFSVTPGVLEERFGRDAARALQIAMYESVDEVGRVCCEESIDADYVKAGALRIARGTNQVPANEGAFAVYERLGLADHYELLDAAQTAERIRVTKALGSLYVRDCAGIHPGKLVRGLARLVERKGGTIYEQTEVTAFQGDGSPRLTTNRGELRAKTIVLAGEAYLTQLAPLHRQLLPLYSLIVLTEPLSPEQWKEIGWQGRECISSNRYTVDYLSRTADGRILFGSRGEPYHYASRIDDRYDRHEPTCRMIRDLAVEWFPALRETSFTHSWGGPVGMPRDWMPSVTYDSTSGVASARGYTGQGVATSNLAGRLLADMIATGSSPLSTLPICGHQSPRWEPEPFRWLGIRAMQGALARLDVRSERTGRPPTGTSLVERLGKH